MFHIIRFIMKYILRCETCLNTKQYLQMLFIFKDITPRQSSLELRACKLLFYTDITKAICSELLTGNSERAKTRVVAPRPHSRTEPNSTQLDCRVELS